MTFAPPEYSMARRCFGFAGAIFIVVIIIWGCTGVIENRLLRLIAVGLPAAIVATLTVEAIISVNNREKLDATPRDTAKQISVDQKQSQDVFSVKFNLVDSDQLGDDRLDVDFAFINRTDSDVIVRGVFLNQAMKSDKNFMGDTDYEGPCKNVAGVSPENHHRQFRDSLLKLEDGTLVGIRASSKITKSFVVPARKSVTLNDSFFTEALSEQYNLMFYCPAVKFIDSDGNNKTAHCAGLYAGLTLGEGIARGGRLRAMAAPPAILLPLDRIKNCTLSPF